MFGTFYPLNVIPFPPFYRSWDHVLLFWDGRLGFGSRVGSRGFSSLFFVKTDIYLQNVGIFVLNGGNIFFSYQRGINSWTLTDLSIKCDKAEEWNRWSSGTRQTKGCVNTSFLLFALLKSEFIFYLLERKTFVHVFETVDLGATTLFKKYRNKDVKCSNHNLSCEFCSCQK